LTNYAECFVTETLGTNLTLGKGSLLHGWHTCFIYCIVCSIPITLGTNETLDIKEKVYQVFLFGHSGSGVTLGT
jgi:hypothetical protein